MTIAAVAMTGTVALGDKDADGAGGTGRGPLAAPPSRRGSPADQRRHAARPCSASRTCSGGVLAVTASLSPRAAVNHRVGTRNGASRQPRGLTEA